MLVVDDEDYIRTALGRFLKGQGHDVVEAQDGLEALTVLKAHAVDLAIVDLMMPRMNGLELLQRMQPDFPGTQAVVISAIEQIIDLAERELNVVRTLNKPFELTELGDALREALNR